MVRAPLALFAVVAVGCSPPASLDAAADASDAASEHAPEIDAGSPWTLELTVQDEALAPLANAWVRAEHGDGRIVEAATDSSGIARLELRGAPWDVTAAMPGRAASSYMGVDAPGVTPLVLLRRPTTPAQTADAQGSVHGVVDPNHFTFVSLAQGMSTASSATTWTATYDYGDDMYPPTGPIEFSVLELDQAQNLVNGEISRTYPRDGTSYTGANAIDVTLPSPARTVISRDVPIEFPAAGILGSDAKFSRVGANAYRARGNWGYLVGLAYAATPVDGRTVLHADYFGGDMAPDFFSAGFTVVRDGAWSVVVQYPSLDGIERITLPVLETLQVDANRLDDRAAFSAVTDGRGSVMFFVQDSKAVVWIGRFVHSERPISSQLPHLPHGLSVADLTDEPTGTILLQYFDLPGDRITGRPEDNANVHLAVRNSTTVSMEGR